MDVFISYSRKDRASADVGGLDVISVIREAFEVAGISYWLDEEGIHSGETFASVISRNIAEAKVFLFVSSVNSNASRWTCGEIATASSYNKRIIPFRIDKSPYDPSITIYLAALDTIDYTSGHTWAIERLIKSVKTYLEELEAEARREKEEKLLLEEKQRLEKEQEEIRRRNEKVIAELSARQAELETRIHALDIRIHNCESKKTHLQSRLKAISRELDSANRRKKRVTRANVVYWPWIAGAGVLIIGLIVGLSLRSRHVIQQYFEMEQVEAPADSAVSSQTDTLVSVTTALSPSAEAVPISPGPVPKDKPKLAEPVKGNKVTQRKVETVPVKEPIPVLKDTLAALEESEPKEVVSKEDSSVIEVAKEQDPEPASIIDHKPIQIQNIWFYWQGGNDGYYMSKEVTRAQWKSVMRPSQKIKDEDYVSMMEASGQEIADFVSRLCQKTQNRYQYVNGSAPNSFKVRLLQ